MAGRLRRTTAQAPCRLRSTLADMSNDTSVSRARADESRIPFLNLAAQYQTISDEIHAAIDRVLASCRFVLGPELEAFESEFAAYCGTRYAVGLNSGTSALHLALLASGIGPGDDVITVSHTFVATAEAIVYSGAHPVFADVDAESSTLDPHLIESAITPRTRALLPVHLYGQCADMDAIMAVARRHDLAVIEDAAQAHGACYRGRRAGSLGQAACFSFYPGKNLGAYGEGGALVTDDPDIAASARRLRDHGQSAKYHHEEVGYNYRLEELQAAVLRVKLRRLDTWNEQRRRAAGAYRQALEGAPVRVQPEETHGDSVHHVFPVFADERDRLRDWLESAGIGTSIHYPVPVHLQAAFKFLGLQEGVLPVTERLAATTLSLPMYPELGRGDIERIADRIHAWGGRSGD